MQEVIPEEAVNIQIMHQRYSLGDSVKILTNLNEEGITTGKGENGQIAVSDPF